MTGHSEGVWAHINVFRQDGQIKVFFKGRVSGVRSGNPRSQCWWRNTEGRGRDFHVDTRPARIEHSRAFRCGEALSVSTWFSHSVLELLPMRKRKRSCHLLEKGLAGSTEHILEEECSCSGGRGPRHRLPQAGQGEFTGIPQTSPSRDTRPSLFSFSSSLLKPGSSWTSDSLARSQGPCLATFLCS